MIQRIRGTCNKCGKSGIDQRFILCDKCAKRTPRGECKICGKKNLDKRRTICGKCDLKQFNTNLGMG